MHLNPVCKSERKLGASTASALGLRAFLLYLRFCAADHKFLYREHWRSRTGDQRRWAACFRLLSQRIGILKKRGGCYERAAAGRRTRALLRARGGSRLGGIPSFSAAASETPSAVARVESAVIARFRIAISLLGQPDHAGGLGWEVAARHCPQVRQIVVPPAGSAAGHRMDGTLARPSRDQATCSVSCAQPEQ